MSRWRRLVAYDGPRGGLYGGLELAVVLLASVCFALGFGFHFGTDNQPIYLIDALRLLHPTILHADWFCAETTHYHRAFTWLAAPLMALSPAGWGIVAALQTAAVAGALALYALARAIVPRRLALATFLLTLAFAFRSETEGLAASYIFNEAFQPSTLGGLGLLLALPLFAAGRWLACGLVLAVAGLLHENYLVLDFGAFTIALLLLGREGLLGRAARVLGPSLAVLLALLPLIVRTAAGDGGDPQEAQRILFEVRGPHHYAPRVFMGAFAPLLAWVVLGVSVGWSALGSAAGRRLAAALVGILAVLWGGTVLSTAIVVPQVVRLFVWRLAPFSDLLGQFMLVAGALMLLADPRRVSALPPQRIALIGGSLSLLLALNYRGGAMTPLLVALVGAVLVAWLGSLVTERFAREPVRRAWPRVLPLLAVLGGLAAIRDPAVKAVDRAIDRPEIHDGLKPDDRALLEWMRTESPEDARFLAPPDMSAVRFVGHRAVVVDWKSSPIRPAELIEWLQRVRDLTGDPAFDGSKDLKGYHQLSREQLLALARKYDTRFIVVRRQRQATLQGLPVAYQNRTYTVVEAQGT